MRYWPSTGDAVPILIVYIEDLPVQSVRGFVVKLLSSAWHTDAF